MTRLVQFSTLKFSCMSAISHCPYPCITDQWNAKYTSYVSNRLIWNYSLQKYLTKVHFDTTEDSKETTENITYLLFSPLVNPFHVTGLFLYPLKT